ncbi:hypothetical protein ACP3UV_22040 [Mixta calida]
MSDIKAALKAEIEKMESFCDEIPFGLCEEDEALLGALRGAAEALVQRDAQIAALEENLNSCLITVAKYSGPDAAPPAPVTLPRVNHPAQFDYADKVAEVLKAKGLKVDGYDE